MVGAAAMPPVLRRTGDLAAILDMAAELTDGYARRRLGDGPWSWVAAPSLRALVDGDLVPAVSLSLVQGPIGAGDESPHALVRRVLRDARRDGDVADLLSGLPLDETPASERVSDTLRQPCGSSAVGAG